LPRSFYIQLHLSKDPQKHDFNRCKASSFQAQDT
jgi:hypothetical protein